NQADARQEILTNRPQDTATLVLYYMSAAQIADELGDTGAAVIFNILATESSLNNQQLFMLIRPVSLQYIYENVGEMRAIGLNETIRTMINGDTLPADIVSQLENSVITSYATARNLIVNENTTLARTALARVSEPNAITIEFDLLRAD